MSNVLIVDDDEKIRTMLRRYLEGEGFTVSEASDGTAGFVQFENNNFDLILLDLTMPGEGGLDLTRRIRMTSEIPIIILTGKDDPVDKAIGLEVGADDYISKPFHLRELLARVNTVLRRYMRTSQPTVVPVSPPVSDRFRFNNWTVDLGCHNVTDTDNQELDLTSAEFKLLSVFVKNPKRVLNRDQLLDHIAGREWVPYDRTVDTQVRRLRVKIESNPDKPEFIKTVRGEGYVFAADVTAL